MQFDRILGEEVNAALSDRVAVQQTEAIPMNVGWQYAGRRAAESQQLRRIVRLIDI